MSDIFKDKMRFLNQHVITEAYLKAWCDPTTPNNGAFVWRISKKHRNISMKSPSSLFSEPDFYTVHDRNGNRLLELEHKLKEVEDKFLLLRDKKLTFHQPLTPENRKTIAIFISSMYARTKRQKEDDLETWQDIGQPMFLVGSCSRWYIFQHWLPNT